METTSKTTTAPVTAADVGKALGLSTSTVAAAMRGHHSVSPATTAKVREMAEKLGYVNRGRGGKQSPIRSRRVHAVEPAKRREDYLVGLARDVGLACSKWLEDRNIPTVLFNRTTPKECAFLSHADDKDIGASE
jgi:DNA-binding LacI/PurR family transcriptional regulator